MILFDYLDNEQFEFMSYDNRAILGSENNYETLIDLVCCSLLIMEI